MQGPPRPEATATSVPLMPKLQTGKDLDPHPLCQPPLCPDRASCRRPPAETHRRPAARALLPPPFLYLLSPLALTLSVPPGSWSRHPISSFRCRTKPPPPGTELPRPSMASSSFASWKPRHRSVAGGEARAPVVARLASWASCRPSRPSSLPLCVRPPPLPSAQLVVPSQPAQPPHLLGPKPSR